MASPFLPMKRLMKCERLAIYLLRGGTVAKIDPATLAAFTLLRRQATGLGLTIAPAASPFIGQDEAHLLGWLAVLQRQVVLTEAGLPTDLRASLATCAAGLAQAAIRLDFRSVARCQTISERRWAPRKTFRLSDPPQPPDAPKQAQIIAFLRGRGATSIAELDQLGASRTLIYKMTKRGQISRLRFGIYAMPSH